MSSPALELQRRLIRAMSAQEKIRASEALRAAAWALKAAVMEPFAIFALMQVFFETVEGQTPSPEWKAKLESASTKFRDLGKKALDWAGAKSGPPTGGPPVPAA